MLRSLSCTSPLWHCFLIKVLCAKQFRPVLPLSSARFFRRSLKNSDLWQHIQTPNPNQFHFCKKKMQTNANSMANNTLRDILESSDTQLNRFLLFCFQLQVILNSWHLFGMRASQNRSIHNQWKMSLNKWCSWFLVTWRQLLQTT